MLQTLAGGAIVLHGLSTVQLVFVADGLDLSLFRICVLIAFVINLVVYFSGRKKPLHSMYLLLFPVSALSLIAALETPSTKPAALMSPYIQSHIVISILAYSLLAIAALYAL
ncbi:phosphohydrolase, partial [Gammaproteobacteria bacterium]|nr:phosphohydrolase [Gammaproteobacteria bacterium]